MPKKATDADVERVRTDIIRVCREIGYKYKVDGEKRRLGRALMERGVESLTGGTKWVAPNGNTTLLDKVLTRIGLDLGRLPQNVKPLLVEIDTSIIEQPQVAVIQRDHKIIQDKPTGVYKVAQDNVDIVPQREPDHLGDIPSVPQHGTLSPFDQDTVDALLQVAEWWKARGSGESPVDEDTAPKFKSYSKNDTDTYSVRLPKALVKAVNAQIAREGAKSGGTFSKLVLWLLWKYVGSPEEFVEKRGIDHAEFDAK